ncbi:hypothetical protein LBMAG48_02450 [Phycisphaerae bacterium]|jgi:hypothetical protein|nr:hypothetical protein LBMAG48_02450 [Phycisphaerae bacterium]
MQHLQLGDLLVKHNVLTSQQRDLVLEAQKTRGGPFGVIAEEMFGVSPNAVERAWAEQYASFAPTIDPRTYPVQSRALEVVNRRQAWQFKLLPLELRTDRSGNPMLLACTTQEHLVRALRFTGWKVGHQCQFILAEALPLGEAMCTHYPMAGMTAASIGDVMVA